MSPGKTPADSGTPAGAPRPRVLLLIKGLGLGGAERLLVDTVGARDPERFDVEVAYVLTQQDALVPALRAMGVRVHCLGGHRSPDVRWTLALRRLLRGGGYDIVHSHLPYTAAFARLVVLSLPRRRRPVVLYTEHSLWKLAAVLTKALNRATVGVDSALVVVSEAARDALPRRLRPRARVVVHGIDRRRFAAVEDRAALRRAARAELGVAEDEVLALTVANMRSEKGYDVLLEAARLTVADGAPVRFAAVGRGPLEAQLRTEAEALGLGDRLLFLGTRTDTGRLMAGADVFVLPSHQEGLPVALMEAMSSGLPVVATTVGGVPNVVTDEVEGLLVEPGRPDLLAGAVIRLAREGATRAGMATASAQRSAIFDVGHAVRAVEDLYDELLGRGSVPTVVHVIPTGAARGGQREARALVEGLDRPGVRRHLLLSLFAGPDDVPVDIDLRHPGGERPAVGFDPRLVLRLRRALARLGPAAVVAHGGDALKYLVPALAGRRVPLAYYATGTFAHPDRRLQVALWRALMGRTDVVAAEGEEVLDELRGRFGVPVERSVLAPNGRDPERFHPPSGPHHDAGPPTLVFVGALTTGKRPDVFVDVVGALRRRGREVSARVCGDGPLAAELAEPAAAAGVELLGTRPDVPDVLRGADVLVFPSLPTGEGMPGVLIEAGMTGLPVVATDVPGVRSVVTDGVTGLVVDPADEGAMVEACDRLVCDSDLRTRLGAAARRRCTESFSFEATAAVWWGFLAPLVARGVSRQRRRRRARSARGSRPVPER